MGGSQSVFSEEALDGYEERTSFTKKEILHVWGRFSQLLEEDTKKKVSKLNRNQILELPELQVSHKLMSEIPELKVNPFRDRICKVFSKQDGKMSFVDFLDMISVFSDNAPKDLKVDYAFRIYDFDDDELISESDLKEVIRRLTTNTKENEEEKENEKENEKEKDEVLTEDHVDKLIENVFKEADLDNDGCLSFAEFEHVISKAPDFVNSFRIRL